MHFRVATNLIAVGVVVFCVVAPCCFASSYIIQLSDVRDRAGISDLTSSSIVIRPITSLIVRDNLIGKERWERFLAVSLPDDSLSKMPTEAAAKYIRDALPGIAIETIESEHDLTFFDLPSQAQATEPLDSLFSQQWYLNNSGQNYLGIHRIVGSMNDELVLKSGLPGMDVRLEQTYADIPAEHTRIVVAIIDSGNDLHHPDLVGQWWKNPDEIPGNHIDDDRNGFVDDTLGYDVSGDILSYFNPVGDNDPSDSVGHGTHIAGIIAAKQDSHGIVGVAPNAALMSVKIRPNATTGVGAAGIMYAINEGARVLNLSWGSPYDSPILQEVVRIAHDNGVLVCVAIGNSGDPSRFYPGAYPEVLTVGAMNSTGHLTSFSTYGAPLDIIAPGEDILSLRAAGTDLYAAASESGVHIVGADSLYYLADGTSMACPMVVGAAARLMSLFPDRSSNEIEQAIRGSAIDLLDPLQHGDVLPGYDTLSGHGRLNIDGAITRLRGDGIFLCEPPDRFRAEGGITFKAAPIGSYSGGYRLRIEDPPGSNQYIQLAQSANLPADSTLFLLPANSPYSGERRISLLSDDNHDQRITLQIAQESRARFTSPLENSTYEYFVPISGSFFGPGFDSLVVTSSSTSVHDRNVLLQSTQEFYDSKITTWELSSLPPGQYDLMATAWFGSASLADTVRVSVTSAFASGWPVKYVGASFLSPAVADIDNDGIPELILGTSGGVYAYSSIGKLKPGWPVYQGTDCRSIPAIVDLDRDGSNDVVFTTEDGLRAVRGNGQPVNSRFGGTITPFEAIGRTSFGLPLVTVGKLGNSSDSALFFLNTTGNVHAYRFDGFPYFFSLSGRYCSMGAVESSTYVYGGNSVTSCDLDGDGRNEVVATYSGREPLSGLGVFDAHTGEPFHDRASPMVQPRGIIYGSVLADLDGDQLPEIITVATNANGVRELSVLTKGTQSLPGFPIAFPQLPGWRGSWPTVAELDLDGKPEILLTFFEFDVGVLYIFNHDGTPYRAIDGIPAGQAIRLPTTFGPPVVANVTGDQYPEILFRTGYIFPNTGPERLQLYDHDLQPVPGWPVQTPSPPSRVFSTIYTPIADDIDGDGLMEIALIGEAGDVFVWDMDATAPRERNGGRLFMDVHNSQLYKPGGVSTDIEPASSLPQKIDLQANYPNPFNPVTTIAYDLPVKTSVHLDVYNVLGQQVTTLVDAHQGAGRYTVRFDGSQYGSGVYFYRLTTETATLSRKMVLQK